MEEILNLVNNKQELLNSNYISEKQNNFLETTLGKTINFGLDIGLRALLPDLIENQVIELKDCIINEGFNEGINKAISSAINFGKSVIGIFTGNFENISQVQNAIQKGGIIDNISNVLDYTIDKTNDKGLINNETANIIKKSKDVILNSINNNIENEFTKQLDSMEKLQKYTENWNNYYKDKDFDGMTREYNKMKEKIKNLIPFENTMKEARRIENLHNLIKNNGKNFNLTQEQLQLANMLT